jgi:hypothetical protein
MPGSAHSGKEKEVMPSCTSSSGPSPSRSSGPPESPKQMFCWDCRPAGTAAARRWRPQGGVQPPAPCRACPAPTSAEVPAANEAPGRAGIRPLLAAVLQAHGGQAHPLQRVGRPRVLAVRASPPNRLEHLARARVRLVGCRHRIEQSPLRCAACKTDPSRSKVPAWLPPGSCCAPATCAGGLTIRQAHERELARINRPVQEDEGQVVWAGGLVLRQLHVVWVDDKRLCPPQPELVLRQERAKWVGSGVLRLQKCTSRRPFLHTTARCIRVN